MEDSSDRRRRLRVPVQSRIRHSLYQGVGEPVFKENSSVDLSSNGISFETLREYQKGNLILLDVHLGEEPLKLLVCAARVEKNETGPGFRVGAELVAIDPLQKRKMADALTKLVDDFLGAKKKAAGLRTKKKPLKKAPPQKPGKKVHRTTLSKKKTSKKR